MAAREQARRISAGALAVDLVRQAETRQRVPAVPVALDQVQRLPDQALRDPLEGVVVFAPVVRRVPAVPVAVVRELTTTRPAGQGL